MKKTNIALLILPFVLIGCGGSENSSVESTKDESANTSETCEPSDMTPGAYSTNVLLPDGTPSTGRTRVMWCVPGAGGACTTPVYVDCNGYGELKNLGLPAATGYLAHCAGYDKAYTYNPNGYIVNEANKHVDITLSLIQSYTSGEGTTSSPYAVGEGAYKASLVKDQIAYVLVSGITGNYKIESWVDTLNAAMSVAEYKDGAAVANGIVDDGNFSYSFELKSGESKLLGVKLDNNPYSSGDPFEFPFAITKA